MIMQVSRSFGDGKIELEEYVSSIKTLIGIKTFIDTVAIGKDQQDLTGNAIEPTKQNQAIHIRPEIPIGKACSTLTAAEIIQFLTILNTRLQITIFTFFKKPVFFFFFKVCYFFNHFFVIELYKLWVQRDFTQNISYRIQILFPFD